MRNQPTPDEESFWFYWNAGLEEILINKFNLFILLATASTFVYFLVIAFQKSPSGDVNGVAIALMQYTTALFAFPLMSFGKGPLSLSTILSKYKFLLYAIFRLFIAASTLLVLPFLAWLATHFGLFEGPGAIVIAGIPFFIVVWMGYTHCVPLDQDRQLRGVSGSILKHPWIYFKGFGSAFGNALLIRLFLGLPIYLCSFFLIELVEGYYDAILLTWVESVAYFVMHFLTIHLIIHRMRFHEKPPETFKT